MKSWLVISLSPLLKYSTLLLFANFEEGDEFESIRVGADLLDSSLTGQAPSAEAKVEINRLDALLLLLILTNPFGHWKSLKLLLAAQSSANEELSFASFACSLPRARSYLNRC